jgi:hypothetical protein
MIPLLLLLSDPAGATDRRAEALASALADAEAVGRAVARVQNAWAGVVLEESQRRRCADDPALADRAARARALGADWGARLNAAREGIDAWAPGRSADEVAPLRRALDAQRGAWAAAAAAQARLVEPWAEGCAPSVLPGPGFPPSEHGRPIDPAEPVAIIGLSGLLCPGLVPLTGAVVVVRGPACAAPTEACGCTPGPLLPGAALTAPPGGPW